MHARTHAHGIELDWPSMYQSHSLHWEVRIGICHVLSWKSYTLGLLEELHSWTGGWVQKNLHAASYGAFCDRPGTSTQRMLLTRSGQRKGLSFGTIGNNCIRYGDG
eukprot:1553165-Amphidinium_carterae.1